MTSNDISFFAKYFAIPMLQCIGLCVFRRYHNSWFWGNNFWGNGRIAMLDAVFSELAWTDISMQALETVLRNISIPCLNDEYIRMLMRLLNCIHAPFQLSSDIVRMLWDVQFRALIPTLRTEHLDFYLAAVERSDPHGIPFSMPTISFLVKKYNTLSHADIVWSSAFGNQRHELLFASLQTLDSMTLNLAFSSIIDTTCWQEDGEHLDFLHHVLFTVHSGFTVHGMNIMTNHVSNIVNPMHVATGITITTNQVFQCAKSLSPESPERSWRCLWYLCHKCSFGMDGRGGVEIVPLHVMEDVKTSMQRIGDERYEQYNHIPFECAVHLMYQICRDRRVELNLAPNLLKNANSHSAIDAACPFFGKYLYIYKTNVGV